MPDLDKTYITSLRGAVTELYHGANDLLVTHGDQPTPGSLADKEIRGLPSPKSIDTPFSIARLLIAYSSEHLTAFVKILKEPIEPLAAWTCVRSMLESCALAAWMTDPRIDRGERIARTFAYRYKALEEQLKYGRAASAPSTELVALEKHIDAVEQAAIAWGYPPIHNQKGKRIGIGREFPKATVVIEQVLDEERIYRLSSAVAHGHSWAITQLGLKPVNATADAANIEGIGGKYFEKQVFVPGMAYIGQGVAKAFAKALWHLWSYMGWDCAPLTALLDSVFDQLQDKVSTRFWRSTTDTA